MLIHLWLFGLHQTGWFAEDGHCPGWHGRGSGTLRGPRHRPLPAPLDQSHPVTDRLAHNLCIALMEETRLNLTEGQEGAGVNTHSYSREEEVRALFLELRNASRRIERKFHKDKQSVCGGKL